MKQTFKISNHLDKHLKQLKTEKGEKSSLELATEGNGARISGDLDVTSNLSADGDLKVSNGTITMDSTKKLYLDGGTDTYIYESGADVLDFYVGDVNLLKLTEAGAGSNPENDKVSIPAKTPLYFDGGTDTYIHEYAADRVQFVVGGVGILSLLEAGGGASDKVIIPALTPLYLDGGTDTYIQERSADNVEIVVGGVALLKFVEAGGGANDKVILQPLTPLYFDDGGNTFINEGAADELHVTVGGARIMQLVEQGDNGNLCWFRESVAVGWTRAQATFSATGVIGSGGTDDTDIDFRFGNKFRLELTGDITNVNLIFPAVSGNFLLVCTTNGDHDVTNWKTYEAGETAATVTDVMWAGGSVPAFTSSGVDIVSFYWDSIEEEAYGVASLAFATP